MVLIRTFTGIAFDLQSPTPEMVDIRDIAHALARVCRFNGHTRGEPYSVAQHSVSVSIRAGMWSQPAARLGLLHDAAEAYLGDMTAPLKRLMPDFVALERDIQAVIFQNFDVWTADSVPISARDAVRDADRRMLATEARDLMGVVNPAAAGFGDRSAYADHPRVIPWPAADAEAAFLARFNSLFGEDGR